MKRVIFAAALGLATPFATPLAAQDRMTQTQCVDSRDGLLALMDLQVATPAVQTDDAGWCLLTDILVQTDARTSTRIASLRWRASDLDRFIEDGLPPRSLEIEGRGLGVVATTGDAVFDYLLKVQMSQVQIGFGAMIRWDGLRNVVVIDAAYVDFDDNNRIEATAQIDGVDLTDAAAIQMSMGRAGLRNLMLKSQFDGWFERFAAMVLGNLLLTDSDISPEAQVARLKRQAAETIAAFPDRFMPENSRVALTAFLRALPTPKGTAQLQLSADPTLGASRVALFATIPGSPSTTQIIETGLDGVTALFTWTPAGDAE